MRRSETAAPHALAMAERSESLGDDGADARSFSAMAAMSRSISSDESPFAVAAAAAASAGPLAAASSVVAAGR